MKDEEFKELRERWKKIYLTLPDHQMIPGSQFKKMIELYEEHLASRDSRILSAVPSEEEIEKLGDEYVAGFADEYKSLAKINFINGFKRGIAG